MAVYVDDAIWHWQGRRWCHLMADDEAELHGFAARLGLKRPSYQGPPKTAAPHYDITAFERDRALRLGAVACSRQEIVAVSRRVRVRNGKSLDSVSFHPAINQPAKILEQRSNLT